MGLMRGSPRTGEPVSAGRGQGPCRGELSLLWAQGGSHGIGERGGEPQTSGARKKNSGENVRASWGKSGWNTLLYIQKFGPLAPEEGELREGGGALWGPPSQKHRPKKKGNPFPLVERHTVPGKVKGKGGHSGGRKEEGGDDRNTQGEGGKSGPEKKVFYDGEHVLFEEYGFREKRGGRLEKKSFCPRRSIVWKRKRDWA